MTQGIAWTTPALLAAYNFSRFKRLADVGGGQGPPARHSYRILIATPSLEGILFDLPQVVSGTSEIWGDEKLSKGGSERDKLIMDAINSRFDNS